MGVEAFEPGGGAAGPWELQRNWVNLLCLKCAAGKAWIGDDHLQRDIIGLGRATTCAMVQAGFF